MSAARRRARADGQAEEGFTLIEMMIALFVFALLASGFAMTMGSSLRVFTRSRVKTVGEQIANDKLEDARRMPYLSLGNVAGNPTGTIPVTQTQIVGGYTFTVTIVVSFVADPVAISIPTGADYKRVLVTVAAVGLGAPPVVMSTLVAPPSKPAADRGQVIVTVNDAVTGLPIQTGIGVDLKNGATVVHKTSDVSGIAAFADLTPSVNVGPSPAPGVNDYYFVNPGTAPALPANYYVHPNSDSSIAGNGNKFTVAPATSQGKTLNIYKAAVVSLRLTDQDLNTLLDQSVLTVTLTSSGGAAPRSITIPANTLLTQFSEAPIGLGIIPTGTYTYIVDAGGGCTSPLKTVTLAANPAYPIDTSIALVDLTVPCSYADVNVHLVDAVDGTPLANMAVTVNGGPLAMSRAYTTDAAGKIPNLRVRAGATPYTVKILAQNGRLAVTPDPSFSVPTSATVTPPNIAVQWPMKTITVTLKDAFTLANLVGETVTISGGPTTKVWSGPTVAGGIYAISVPGGTGYPVYTIVVSPDAAGRLGTTQTVLSDTAASPITINDPWTMMPVTVTVTDFLTGLPINNTAVQLTGGPANPAMTQLITNASGQVTFLSEPSGTSPNYTITVPAFGGRLLATTTFSPVGPGPAAVPITVAWPMANFTITLKSTTGGLLLAGRTVQVTGGPDAYSPASQVTPASGAVTFSVPMGATTYTVTVPAFGVSPVTTVFQAVTVNPTNLTVNVAP